MCGKFGLCELGGLFSLHIMHSSLLLANFNLPPPYFSRNLADTRSLLSFHHLNCDFSSAISSPLTRRKPRKIIRNVLHYSGLTVLKALDDDFSSAIYQQTHSKYVHTLNDLSVGLPLMSKLLMNCRCEPESEISNGFSNLLWASHKIVEQSKLTILIN